MNIQTLLNKTGWTEQQQQFEGTLIYKITNIKDAQISQVIIKRSNEEVSVDLFVPDRNGDKMSLVLSVDNTINMVKTDPDIKNEKDVEHFLNMVSSMTQGTKGVFMPSRKIEEENKTKLAV